MQNPMSWCGGNLWCAVPVAAGATLSAALSTLAEIDLSAWTARATAGLALAGLVGGGVVGGIVWLIGRYDMVRIKRRRENIQAEIDERKLLDDANKISLTAQLAEMQSKADAVAKESLDNQGRMREHLHELRNSNQVIRLENDSLRISLAAMQKQFLELSAQLHATDMALHAAREEMHQTNIKFKETLAKLEVSEKQRNDLVLELASLRAGHQSNTDRLDRLEGAVTDTATLDNTAATRDNTAAIEAAKRGA